MSPDRPSTWLARAILEEALSHATLREPPAQPCARLGGLDAHALPVQLELDVGSGEQPCALAQILRYHDLSLGTNPVSHTETV